MSESILSIESVSEYVGSRPALSSLVDAKSLTVQEVGDGNLNQVFICTDSSGARLVLKQALPYVRLVGPDWPMSEDRAAREAHTITEHSRLSAANVCALIEYDADRYVLALEDLTDHDVLRTRLNAGGPFGDVFEQMGRYVADVAFGTSWLGLGEEQFRLAAAAAVNSELCKLTEDVVFTEPYLGADRNSWRPQIDSLVRSLQADSEWVGAAMTMKRRFLTRQEALLHGDLHTGSIFIRGSAAPVSAKAFDSEFAFYGPVGYDLGLLWANIVAAASRAAVLDEPDRAASLLSHIATSWSAFESRMRDLWPERWEPSAYPDVMLSQRLTDILDDSWGFAGCEASRRIIGLAKLSDIETLDDEQYARAASAVLRIGRTALVSRGTLPIDEHIDAMHTELRL
ncbi:S-methyl-5-thioribose kinase [Epidermidibacterium keratini]|uniref:S-methyl-5-thioribose kinase n=1 Tax=Epidermidibacterium keratini TaxID=1891644 RepID=A0A7L4YN41_9ACTN|nr:S-methyl-5-thioribose kinase [Epidermidibacterium keratini]QHC00303.1 S-methyl-5-thioribose kinase [Epidermidibacterium keratini]